MFIQRKNTLPLLLHLILILYFSSTQVLWASEVIFSHEHGFYEEPFELIISVDEDNASIYYTLDGTHPFYSISAVINSSPVSLFIDPMNTSNRDKAPGFIVRACAVKNDTLITDVESRTYLFINHIKELSTDGELPGSGWLSTNSPQDINYGLDPEVYNNTDFSDDFLKSFTSIPTMSLVTDLANLFNPDSGIYVNAMLHGDEWERPASLELINPDGSEGFSVNCGIRIRGGWSRHNECPKRAFRFFFRDVYGKTKLEYPLFGDEGADEFDKFDLRTSMNYSWSYYGDSQNTFLRDVFSRDTQRDMNEPYTRSRYYHLYINGTYWGLYQTQERSEANYVATYLGGLQEDYDVIKVNIGENFDIYEIEATDGSLDGWNRLWTQTYNGVNDELYFRLQGKNADGTLNPGYEKLLDVNNLIDYLLITYFTADYDAPVSAFRGNQDPNNFYAVFNRTNPDGFKFFRHDAEHSLFNNPWGTNRTGPFLAGSQFQKSNPQWIHQKLSGNSKYQLKFADRVYKHFFNNGALTLENSRARINERKAQIESAIIAESARWGDSKSQEPLTKHHWNSAVSFILNDFLPGRAETVLSQLKSKHLWKDLLPPTLNKFGGIVEKGFSLTMNSGSDQVYYTLNGSDPAESNEAILYTEAVTIYSTSELNARTFKNNEWSPLLTTTFIINEDFSSLKITELHYHPADEDTINDTEFEFIELKNTGNESLDLGFVRFVNGIDYTFPVETSIDPQNFIVLCSNRERFNQRYGWESDGEYEGQFDNGGERIVMVSASGDTILSFRYDDELPWPLEADGEGYSLVSGETNPSGDPNDAAYWTLSSELNGSPGSDDAVSSAEKYTSLLPESFILFQNYPNPFNPSTKISYSIPSGTVVTLNVFNILGEKIATLVNGYHQAGFYEINFFGENLSAGVYFYQLRTTEFSEARRMVLLK